MNSMHYCQYCATCIHCSVHKNLVIYFRQLALVDFNYWLYLFRISVVGYCVKFVVESVADEYVM